MTQANAWRFWRSTRSGIVAAFNTASRLVPSGAFKELYEASLDVIR